MSEEVVSFAEFRARIKGAAFVRDDERRCKHHHMTLDEHGGTVDCDDCGKNLSAFAVLCHFVREWGKIQEWKAECHAYGQKMRDEALLTWRTYRSWRPHLRAAQYIEKQWRGKMAPCCPHCGNGLLPEDFLDGSRGSRGKEHELQLRAEQKAKQAN